LIPVTAGSNPAAPTIYKEQMAQTQLVRPVTILCAAIWVQDGSAHVHQPKNVPYGFVVTGRRHHNCWQILTMINRDETIERRRKEGLIKQGFLTSDNWFVDREEGMHIAFLAGQTHQNTGELFSEDLY
jgi:hypothetical protein